MLIQKTTLGTNLIAQHVYSSTGLLIGFWAEMAIKGMDREPGQWRVEHYAYGWQGGIKDWHKMFTQDFTISADTVDQPTYDVTGDWDYSDSNSWDTCDDTPDPEETGTVTLTQSGNTFTLTTDEGTVDGVVYDATYTTSETFPENAPDGTPGMLTENIVFTLSSNSAGSGTFTATWVADNTNFSCGWGNDFTLTKKVAQPGVAQPGVVGDGGGGG